MLKAEGQDRKCGRCRHSYKEHDRNEWIKPCMECDCVDFRWERSRHKIQGLDKARGED